MRRGLAPLTIAATVICVEALLIPKVVNGDGLGYLRAAPEGVIVPGHLAYLPLLRFLGKFGGWSTPLALLGPARAISILCGAIAALALFGAVRRLLDERSAIIAAIGMELSYGALQAASDVETYAPALAAICATTYCATRRRCGGGWGWCVASVIGASIAALLHIENVLFVLPTGLLCVDGRVRRRWREASAVIVGAGVIIGAVYLAAFAARGESIASGVQWILSANHGFRYPMGLRLPVVTLYGIAKTLVVVPSPNEASWTAVIGHTLIGVVALGALLALSFNPRRRAALSGVTTCSWIVPYAIVGVLFFASDSERWIFLLPIAWIAAAAGVTSLRALRIAIALLAGLFTLNLAWGLPVARDARRRVKASDVGRHLRAGDLLIGPGHAWDEYIGFYDGPAVEHFPMIYFCGALGGSAPMLEELHSRIERARARGARVYFARGADGIESPGWKDLRLFDISPRSLSEQLRGRLVPVAADLSRLDP